jgi:hypothetical protein
VKWQSPRGSTGRVPVAEVLQLEPQDPIGMINMTIVSAAVYPPGYWQTFASSSSWQHFTEAGMAVAVNSGNSSTSTTAMTEDRGYIIQLITKGVSEPVLLRIVRGLRWK